MQITVVNQNNNTPSFGKFIFAKYAQDIAKRELKTPKLQDRFLEMIASQNKNRTNIHLDYDLIDFEEPYLKAKVGKFSLSQLHPNLGIKESPMCFLKRTAIVANFCKRLYFS